MRSNAKMKGYQSGGYVGGDIYSARPGPDDVAGHDPFTPDVRALVQAMTQQTAPAPQQRAPGGQPTHRIAPQGMSANASRVMQQIMSQQTPGWGSALSKIAKRGYHRAQR